MKLKYLVTGTGRCGTVFMARLLTSVGIPCGHESVFDFNGLELAKKRINGEADIILSEIAKTNHGNDVPFPVENLGAIQAESSYMAAPFLSEDVLADTKIIHIVREPVKVVHSFCKYINYFTCVEPTNEWEQFIYTHLPELKSHLPQYDRASLFFVLWNEMIEKTDVNLFYKIEDNASKILDFLDKNTKEYYSNQKANTCEKPFDETFSIGMIQSKEIKQRFSQISRKYGYKSSDILFC